MDEELTIGKTVKVSMGDEIPDAYGIVTQIDHDSARVFVTTGYFAGVLIRVNYEDIMEE